MCQAHLLLSIAYAVLASSTCGVREKCDILDNSLLPQERLGNPEQDDVWPGKGSLVAHNQWIFENVQNDSLRLARNKSLAKSTKSFTYAPSEILANLGELHRGAP